VQVLAQPRWLPRSHAPLARDDPRLWTVPRIAQPCSSRKVIVNPQPETPSFHDSIRNISYIATRWNNGEVTTQPAHPHRVGSSTESCQRAIFRHLSPGLNNSFPVSHAGRNLLHPAEHHPSRRQTSLPKVWIARGRKHGVKSWSHWFRNGRPTNYLGRE